MSIRVIKVIFMGTPDYAKIILKKILEDRNFEVELVVTQPDRAVGRAKVLTPPPVKKLAMDFSLKVTQPTTLKNRALISQISSLKPDFIVVAAYGQILPKEILTIAPCINLHASLLPKYRGASPVQEAILNGDRFSGVTAMVMEEGLDSGNMLSFSYTKLSKDIRVDELMDRLSFMAGDLILSTLKEFNNLVPIPQFHCNASYCKKVKRVDGLIDLNLSAEEVYRKFRAFYGWPSIFFDNGLKLLDINIVDNGNDKSEFRRDEDVGKILEIRDNSVVVAFKKGSIEIQTLQPKGKRAMSGKAFLVGRGLKVGDKIF
jgi:methionyl-tRNA formyltransferase